MTHLINGHNCLIFDIFHDCSHKVDNYIQVWNGNGKNLLFSHLALDGNNKHNDLCVKTLKGKKKQ